MAAASAVSLLVAVLLSACLLGYFADAAPPSKRSTLDQPADRACGSQLGLTAEKKLAAHTKYMFQIVARYGPSSPQAKAFVLEDQLDKVAAQVAEARKAKHEVPSAEVAWMTQQVLAGPPTREGRHGRRLLAPAASQQKTISVDTFFHVIASNGTTLGGNITQKAVNAQMDALNQAFRPYGFRFKLVGTDYVNNTQWHHECADSSSDAPSDMKRALRRGDMSALNLYSCGTKYGGLLGYANFPMDFFGPDGALTEDVYMDGVVFDFNSVPGGAYGTNYSLGYTLVHEVGHWLGLYHTFAEGDTPLCAFDYGNLNSNGSEIMNDDLIADTPPQLNATRGCPAPGTKDSCPQFRGYDNVNNYMDYSFDECYTEFTRGQSARMWGVWSAYRAPAVKAAPALKKAATGTAKAKSRGGGV